MKTILIRNVLPDEGAAIHQLIKLCPPLDLNSVYAYFLITHHHKNTCYVAVNNDSEIMGVVTAYILPDNPQTIFIWQIAVHPQARGQGIATKLLTRLVTMRGNIKTIQTTVSPSNLASLSSFKKLAQSLGAKFQAHEFLKSDACGEGHEAEDLITLSIP